MFRCKPATFNGSHNKQKSKLLIFLYDRYKNLRKRGGLGVKELSDLSGVSYEYLCARLTALSGWKYINRRSRANNNKPPYLYSISRKGIRFVEKRIPEDKMNEYIQELDARTMELDRQHDGNFRAIFGA